MRRIALIAALVSLFGLSTALAQNNDTALVPYWIEMMQDPGVNFHSTQRAFETYWANRTQEKGNGYKAFKRWEWFMEQEVKADGSYQKRSDLDTEFKAFDAIHGPSHGSGGFSAQSVSGTWQSLGPIQLPNNGTGQPNGLGRINCVEPHPTDTGTILIGAPNGGIWKTTNHGFTWTSNTDTLVSMQISNIRWNPINDSIVYAGTGDRDAGSRSQKGVIKSIDAGNSWFTANTGMGNRTVAMLAIHPDHPDTILAACSGGIYKTINGGTNWSRKSSNTSYYKDIVYMPGNPSIAYATAVGNFYRSADGGETWTNITNGIGSGNRGVIGVTPDDSLYVYFLLCQGSAFAGMYRSVDGGLTFSTRSTTPNIMDWSTTGSGSGGQAWYDLDVAVDPANKDIVYGAGVNVFKSTNGGTNWAINAHWVGSGGASAVHADHHALEFSPDGKRLYSGNDGGVYYTQDGTNWTDISSGIGIAEVYKIGQARYNEDLVINGYQDNGTAIYYGPNTWSTEIGGDGMECIVDKLDNNFMYGALYFGAIRRSTNNGASFGTVGGSGVNGITESGAWVTPYILGVDDDSVMFAGYRNLWRSTNIKTGSVSWAKISNSLGGSNSSTLRVIEQSPADPDVLYMARADRKLFRTDNAYAASPTWTDLTSSLPNNSVPTDLEAHPVLDSVIYMTQSNNIYESTDFGATWTDISGNLPNISLRAIVFDENSYDGIYVGGTPGVYYKDSSMTDWTSFYDGLPTDVSVTELEIFYDTLQPALSKLRASTYGRGLWSSDLYDDGTSEPIADFTGNTSACVSEQIEMRDRSAYNPTSWSWSINPGTYTLASGASLSDKDLLVSFDTSGYYTVTHTATNGNGTDTVVKINLILISDTSSASCQTTTQNGAGYGIGIQRVLIAGLDHRSSGFDGINSYHDYTCQSVAYLQPDTSYPIDVVVGAWNDEDVEVYIDYNGDGDFADTSEHVLSFARGRNTRSDTLTTIANPQLNTHLRMRIVSDFWSLNGNSCKGLGYGESEDIYVYFDVPSVEIFQDTTAICEGDSVEFWATTDGRIDSLSWDFGSGASPASAIGVGPHTVLYSGGSNADVTVQFNTTISDDTLSVASHKYPTPRVSLVSNDSICQFDTLKLEYTDSLSYSALQYSWYRDTINLNNTDTLYNPVLQNLTDSGDYYIIADNNGCVDTSNSLNIYVKPVPTGLSMQRWTPVVQCLNGNQFYFEDATSTNIPYTRVWEMGDSTTYTSDTVTHSYQSEGVYLVWLRTTTNLGCEASANFQFLVDASPAAGFTLSDTALCFDHNSFTLRDISTITTGSIGRVWNFGDGTSSSVDSVVKTYATQGMYQGQLVSLSNKGCTDTATFTIDVWPNPEAMIATTDTVLCEPGNSFEFYNQSTIARGTSTPSWELGDGAQSFSDTVLHQYASGGLYTLKLVMTSDNNCIDSSSATIEVLDGPVLSYTVNDSAQCLAGNAFELEDQSRYMWSVFQTRIWKFGDGDTSSLDSLAKSYASPGTYQAWMISTNQDNCTDSVQFQLEVFAQPDGLFSFSSGLPAQYSFEPADTALVAYLWDFGDGDTSTAMRPTHEYTSNGTYTVWLTVDNSNGCVDSTSQDITETQVGILSLDPIRYLIYPNPNDGNMTIRFATQAHHSILMINNLGQVVRSLQLSKDQREVQIEGLSSGVYHLSVEEAGKKSVSTVVVK